MSQETYILSQDTNYISIYKNDVLFIKSKSEVNWYGKVTSNINYEKEIVIVSTQIKYLTNLLVSFKIIQNNLNKNISFIKRSNKMKVENDIFEKEYYGPLIFKLSYNVFVNDKQICNCKCLDSFLNFKAESKYEITFFNENELNLYALFYICLTHPILEEA